jgi:hypothetical protein
MLFLVSIVQKSIKVWYRSQTRRVTLFVSCQRGGGLFRRAIFQLEFHEAEVMNQYASALIVCICLGAVAAVAAGCDNGSSTPSGGAGATTVAGAGAPATGGGGAPAVGGGTTFGGTPGTGGGTVGTGGGAADEIPLVANATGFVTNATLMIQGAWYAYGDGEGSDGTVANSDCVLLGGHMPSDCSMITTPMFGSFPNMNSSMCTAGTVAKVISGTVGCTAPATTCPDYSNLFGAGIGVDLNNAGEDGGTGKQPYNATLAGVIGFAFDIDTPPLGGMRVEFPTQTTQTTAAMWHPGTTNLSPVVAGHNRILFSDVSSPTYVMPAVTFDPTTLLSVQFHVPTTTASTAAYMFCISGFSAITGTP